MSGIQQTISPETNTPFIQTYRILPYGENSTNWNAYINELVVSPNYNSSSYKNIINGGNSNFEVNSTAILTYNNMTQTGVTVSLENAYNVFYGLINSSDTGIQVDVSGSVCFTDPCVNSSNIATNCYVADGIREFIAAIEVTPAVSFFACENGLNITISPIVGSSSGSCPIESFNTSGSFAPFTFPIGFNDVTNVEATLISILTLSDYSNYIDCAAMWAPVEFLLVDVNGNPASYANACSLNVSPLDTCFNVYFVILRCCQGYNFVLVSDTVSLQIILYLGSNSVFITTSAISGYSIPM